MKKNKDIEQIKEIINNSESFLLVTDKAFLIDGDKEEIATNLMMAILQNDIIASTVLGLTDFFFTKGRTSMLEKALQMKMDQKFKVVAEPAKSKMDIN